MGPLPIPEAASSQALPPGTLLLLLAPVPSACTVDHRTFHRTRLPDCHHSKSDEGDYLMPSSISYLVVYHVIKQYLGTANEGISVPVSTISGQLASGLVPS